MSLYDGWLTKISARFQKRVDDMQAHYNFDLGPEFEHAIVDVLKESLPERAGVCRGFIVDQSGARAGDDIIIYDAARFPTVRAVAKKGGQKEDVPAEAVLAYIEAKHTLKWMAHENDGGSLAKAIRQIQKVKGLRREQVPWSTITEHVNLSGGGFSITPPRTAATTRNPWYCAILARNLDMTGEVESSAELLESPLAEGEDMRPDVIASPQLFVSPGLVEGKQVTFSPFMGPGKCAVTVKAADGNGLGLAVVHLLWAIEEVFLPSIPWSLLLSEHVRGFPMRVDASNNETAEKKAGDSDA